MDDKWKDDGDEGDEDEDFKEKEICINCGKIIEKCKCWAQ